ncbi:hypothetical protein C0J52_18656 [Blattella germanica]|nr:hypothetical protein C0J52_18656 [Blattella germanica]
MLSPLLFNFVLEQAIKSLEDKGGVQLNGIHKLLVYADDIALLGDSEEILKDNMHILRSNTRKLGLEVNDIRGLKLMMMMMMMIMMIIIIAYVRTAMNLWVR